MATLISLLFGLLLTGLLYAGGAPTAYWMITLIGSIFILGGRAILTELGVSRK